VQNDFAYTGLISALVSAAVMALGMYLTYRANMAQRRNEAAAQQTNDKKAEAEADKLEIETKRLNTESNLAQMEYYIKIVTEMRKEQTDNMISMRLMKEQVFLLEGKVSELAREKNMLEAENANNKRRIIALEFENSELKNKVELLEIHNHITKPKEKEEHVPPFRDNSLPDLGEPRDSDPTGNIR